jgi:hypothetical protein
MAVARTVVRAGQRKFYIYDPAVHAGDELGGMTAKQDDDGVHIIASPLQVQYWIDQGLLGEEPKDKLSDNSKALLKQITRGRSDSDDDPVRVPKYSRPMQSGAPAYAGTLAERRRKAQKKDQAAKKNGNKTQPAKKPPMTPSAAPTPPKPPAA